MKDYLNDYMAHITHDIMPFWDKRCIDTQCGGYLTCFDREGNLTDDKKYCWFQGRQLYTYALLYNRIAMRSEWLDNAAHGYRFLCDKAYAGGGRWNYRLTREGEVEIGTTSIFSDFHILQGIGEYLRAIGGGDTQDRRLLNDCYDAMERNMFDPQFKDVYENSWSETFIWHDMYMTCLSAVIPCIPLLGEERTRRLADECVDKIVNWFARDDKRLVFEAVTRDNGIVMDTAQGRFINPGHTMESAWFLMQLAELRGDEALLRRAIQLCDWAYDAGHDQEMGGLVSYLDALGSEPVAIDWFLETNSLWDDKVWWSNAEALAAYAGCYAATGERRYRERFEAQHAYCRQNFFDSVYGEWYERLYRDGSVKVADKGTEWKCAFHLVRAMVFTVDAFRRIKREEKHYE